MGVSLNGGTPKSSILIGFSMKQTHPFWGTVPLFLGTTHMEDGWFLFHMVFCGATFF